MVKVAPMKLRVRLLTYRLDVGNLDQQQTLRPQPLTGVPHHVERTFQMLNRMKDGDHVLRLWLDGGVLIEALGDRQPENIGGITRVTLVRLETGSLVAHRAQDIHNLAAARSHIEDTKAGLEDGPEALEAVHRNLA